MIRFDGSTIFGQITLRQSGPMPTTRQMRERLPGVTGYRIYQLAGPNPDTRVWTIVGRIVALNMNQLERVIEKGFTYLDGNVYLFETNGGLKYRNCELTDYRPVAPYQSLIIQGLRYASCFVQGTIEQASP